MKIKFRDDGTPSQGDDLVESHLFKSRFDVE